MLRFQRTLACTFVCLICTMSAPAAASFIERCLLIVRIAELPKYSAGHAHLRVQVDGVLRLGRSHGDCSTFKQTNQISLSVPTDRPRLQPGDELVLRYEHADGMCAASRACSNQHWHLLEAVDRAQQE